MNIKNHIKEIEKEVKKHKFSGVCSIRQGKDIIYEACHGCLDWANQVKVNIDTRFGIASGTKLFTALGIIKLIEMKKCHLEDRLNDFLPKQFAHYSDAVTIKHLLTHTSCIPDYFDEEKINDFGQFFVDKPWYELMKPSDYLSIMPQTQMDFEPGSKFKYNDGGFVLLAFIIESITGDYHQWIKKEILDKADMSQSGFFKLNQLPVNTAYGYKNISKEPYETNLYNLPIIGGGDGGMFTNAEDMHRFWVCFIDGQLVSHHWVKEMLKPHAHSKDLSYGLGVWLKKDGQDYIPLIIGEDCGVSFESGYHIKSNIVYTVLSNTQDGVWPITRLFI